MEQQKELSWLDGVEDGEIIPDSDCGSWPVNEMWKDMDMDYSHGWEQMRSFLISGFGITESVADFVASSSYNQLMVNVNSEDDSLPIPDYELVRRDKDA